MMFKSALVGTALLLISTASTAAIVPGGRLFVIDSEVDIIATFIDGAGAGFNNTTALVLPGPELGPIFHNHNSAPGDIFNLGTFTAGTELIFALDVTNTEDRFFSGPASANPDNFVHAVIDSAFALNTVKVSFEDIFGGGDQNYGDMGFSLSNVRVEASPVPLPAPLGLFAAGLVTLWRRRTTQ